MTKSDSPTCLECGSMENIEYHHLSYELEVTVPLCRDCHNEVHKNKSHTLYPVDQRKEATSRDLVWSAVLELLTESDVFKKSDVRQRIAGATSDTTISRALQSMRKMNVIEYDTGSKRYRPGTELDPLRGGS